MVLVDGAGNGGHTEMFAKGQIFSGKDIPYFLVISGNVKKMEKNLQSILRLYPVNFFSHYKL